MPGKRTFRRGFGLGVTGRRITLIAATKYRRKVNQSTTNSKDVSSFGGRLRWIRQNKGMTLRQFADRLHCTPGYLSKLESGKATRPADRFIVSVSMTFYVNGDWLRDGVGAPFGMPVANKKAQSDWLETQWNKIIPLLSELPNALAAKSVLNCVLGSASLQELQEIWRRVRSLPGLSSPAIFFWNDVFTECQFSRLSFSGESSGASNIDKLDNELPAAKVGDVTSEVPTWPGLKAELLKLTVERGMKAWLADELGVSRQVVNNWLATSDQGRPDAENTLLLLRWAKGGGGKIKIPRK